MSTTPILYRTVAEDNSPAIQVPQQHFKKPLQYESQPGRVHQQLNLYSEERNFYFTPIHKVGITNMESTQVEIKLQPDGGGATRIIYGNASNFTRTKDPSEFRYERPLMMNAWAQTTMEDFSLVDSLQRQDNFELQREIDALRAKVESLEGDLRVHVELLNQIHATAALKPTLQRSSTDHLTTTPPPTPSMQHQQQHQQQSQPQQQQQHLYQQHQHQRPRRISPVTPNGVMYTTQPNEVMTPQIINAGQMQQVDHAHMSPATDSFKYTIVANNCEPIEIQLAEEDGALNLNNSADSGRLEICLSADEQNVQNKENMSRIKRKVKKERKINTPPLPPQSGILVKRRKFPSNEENHEESSTSPPQNYYNGHNNQQTQMTPQQAYFHQTADDVPSSMKQQQANGQISKRRSPANKHLKTETSPNVLRHDDNVMVSIGPNNTRVPYQLYDSMTWDSASIATRKLLMAIFDRETLATHSMTGKPSPAFKGQSKPQKDRLNPSVIEDIIFVVTRRCKATEKEVRNAVTTKCADENKMFKLSLSKQKAIHDQKEKENPRIPLSNQDQNQNQGLHSRA